MEETSFGPGRHRLVIGMQIVYVGLLAAMLLLGTVLVLTQLGGVVLGAGGLVEATSTTLGPWVFGVAATLGIWTLLLAYATGVRPSE